MHGRNQQLSTERLKARCNKTRPFSLTPTISLLTRLNYYPSTPKRSQNRHEYSTITKTRFYDALDRSGGSKSFRTIADENAPSLGIAAR